MRARLTVAATAVALAAVAALAPAAGAQDPLPTPTPTPTPTPSATPTPSPTPTPTPTPEEQEEAERDERDRESKNVRRVYRDFERDGRIDDCDHPRRALVRARRSIEASYADEYPDFRDALTAAIERHDDGDCVEQDVSPEQESGDGTGDGGGGTGTTPGTTTPPPPPPPPPPPAAAPESGALPDFGDDNPTDDGGFGGGGFGDGDDGGSGDVNPLPGEDAIPEGAPSPEATPVPPPAEPLPPTLVVTRAAADPNLFVPGTLLAIALAGLLIAGLSALAARRSERFAGVSQAWREAAWRTSGTWNDFTDWLRLGR